MRPKVSAILLAAGLSRRMGAQNKLLLQVDGVPMIRHTVLRYREAVDGAILVVTGHDASAVEEVLKGTGAETVFNPDFAQGQQTSVACGLRAAKEADILMIGLGDQPLLTAADIRTLIEAHEAADRARISIPTKGDSRGNPIVVPAALRTRLLEDPKGPGCKRFTRTHLDHVQYLPMSAQGFFTDVDTPAAYAALAQHKLEVAR